MITIDHSTYNETVTTHELGWLNLDSESWFECKACSESPLCYEYQLQRIKYDYDYWILYTHISEWVGPVELWYGYSWQIQRWLLNIHLRTWTRGAQPEARGMSHMTVLELSATTSKRLLNIYSHMIQIGQSRKTVTRRVNDKLSDDDDYYWIVYTHILGFGEVLWLCYKYQR